MSRRLVLENQCQPKAVRTAIPRKERKLDIHRRFKTHENNFIHAIIAKRIDNINASQVFKFKNVFPRRLRRTRSSQDVGRPGSRSQRRVNYGNKRYRRYIVSRLQATLVFFKK